MKADYTHFKNFFKNFYIDINIILFVKVKSWIVLVSLILPTFFPISSTACKDIIVMGDATAGDFNLMMKVRDPSRPGLQVLCMIDSGYRYSYHLPNIKGDEKEYVVKHKFIGVVTKGDAPPNIVKAGMALSDAGIAYGDADSPSYWINPLKTAWDDFDWIRYACQAADNEDEAIDLLKDVIKMHAPGVSENLFVVGPEKGYVMEGDVVRYNVSEVNDILVMSNYPKGLWDYRLIKRFFVSRSFDFEKEEKVRKGSVVRLGGLLGIKILDLNEKGIIARLWPVGKSVFIKVKDGKLVDPFWVEVLDVGEGRASIRVSYKYKVWEREILRRLEERYGNIDVKDLINISRLHVDDLKGIRGMCEGSNKATAIFKIPHRDHSYLSCMWFAPDQCSSVYVPVHICCKEIFDPYENGDAARLAKKILELFGHDGFSNYASRIEDVFIKEMRGVEDIARCIIQKGGDPSDFFTKIDLEMQRQAYLMEMLVVSLKENEKDIPVTWGEDYGVTILKLADILDSLDIDDARIIGEIAKSIAELKFEEFVFSENLTDYRLSLFKDGLKRIDEGDLEQGLQRLYEFVSGCYRAETRGLEEHEVLAPALICFCMIIIMILIWVSKRIKV